MVVQAPSRDSASSAKRSLIEFLTVNFNTVFPSRVGVHNQQFAPDCNANSVALIFASRGMSAGVETSLHKRAFNYRSEL